MTSASERWVNKVRSVSDCVIHEKRLLADLIWDLGVFHGMRKFPPETQQRCWSEDALFVMQYPPQMAAFLLHLRQYSIRSYLEVGVGSGGTFIVMTEVLNRYSNLGSSVSVDIHEIKHLHDYTEINERSKALIMDSRGQEFHKFIENNRFDLVLVDGDHRYEAVMSDVDLCLKTSAMVAMHDIVDIDLPDVHRAWNDVKKSHRDMLFYEFIESPSDCQRMGIGLIVNPELICPII